MTISLHISKLLLDNDEVAIKGLGYFKSSEQKAYHHPVNHEFTPKTKVISFTLDKMANSALLATAIGTADADKLIADFVLKTITDLKLGKSIEFPYLGTLKKHEKGHVVFMQSDEMNFEKSFFGLESFKLEPNKKVAAAPVVVPVKEEKKKRTLMWFIIAIAGLAAILIIGFVFFENDLKSNDKQIVENKDVSAKTDDKTTPSVVEDTASIANDTSNEDAMANVETDDSAKIPEQSDVASESDNSATETQSSEIEVAEDVNVASHNSKYYVIAGCFKSSYRAKKLVKDLKKGDYPNATINGKTKSGLIRVCYDGFDTESQADKYMIEVSAKEGKELWIQEIDN